MSTQDAVKLVNKARKYIYVNGCPSPLAILSITLNSIHTDNPIIQIREIKIYKYKTIYIPCKILGYKVKVI